MPDGFALEAVLRDEALEIETVEIDRPVDTPSLAAIGQAIAEMRREHSA